MSHQKKSHPFPACLPWLVFSLVFLGAETVGAQIRTVLVSPVPGDPVASGTALQNALAGISSPSATNRWLLKIEPGIYDVGASSLNMRSWVDIEGSGIGATTIRGSNPPFDEVGGDATVHGADNAELRHLTVEAVSSAAAPDVMAMANYVASPRLYRVKLTVTVQNSGWGLRNVGAAPLIEECEISVTAAAATGGEAYGLVFRGLPPGSSRSSILRSQITVSGASGNYGVYMVEAQTLTSIRDSRIDVTGGSTSQGLYAIGLSGWFGQETLSIRNTEVYATGGSTASYGLRFVHGAAISPDIFQSKIFASTCGVCTDPPSSSGGIVGSAIRGGTNTVRFAGSIAIASTHLGGGPATATVFMACIGVWDEFGTFYTNNSCP